MFELIQMYLDEDRKTKEQEQREYIKHLSESFDKVRKEEEVRRKARTLDEISEGVQLHRQQVIRTMKDNEDKFVHWPEPHPSQPTKYALVEHMRQHQDEKDWELGLDF